MEIFQNLCCPRCLSTGGLTNTCDCRRSTIKEELRVLHNMVLQLTLADLSVLAKNTPFKYMFLGAHNQRLYFVIRSCENGSLFQLISIVVGVECSMRWQPLITINEPTFRINNMIHVLERIQDPQTYSHLSMQYNFVLLINFERAKIINVNDGSQTEYAVRFDERYDQMDFKDSVLVDGMWRGFAHVGEKVFFGTLHFIENHCTFESIQRIRTNGLYLRQTIAVKYLYHIIVRFTDARHPIYAILLTTVGGDCETKEYTIAPSNETCCGLCEFSHPFNLQQNKHFRVHSMMMRGERLYVCSTKMSNEVAFYGIEFDDSAGTFFASQCIRIRVDLHPIEHYVTFSDEKLIICSRYEWSTSRVLQAQTVDLKEPSKLVALCLRVLDVNPVYGHAARIAQLL